jgi:predicted peptidase
VTYLDSVWGAMAINYADYKPKKGQERHPLIVWLHGGGEGGSDVTIPISSNKACNFASAEIQSFFDGAYVLVPQCPTWWMDDGGTSVPSIKTNADTKYRRVLKYVIDRYIQDNSNIDLRRIYVGGCSNGGFMTLRLLLDYPDYFAAAFPVCEGLNNKFLTDGDIDRIKNIPIWFVTAATDRTFPAPFFTVPAYDRLIKAGAQNTYLSYFKNVIDTSGRYKNNGMPYEYSGHWSWIYVYNNKVSQIIDGKEISLMAWLSAQKK